MRKTIMSAAALVAFAPQISMAALLFGDAENGAKVHAAKCDACHAERFAGEGEKIYLRQDHNVNTIEGLMKQVNMCNTQIGLNLGETDIDDLVIYLNENFYEFE